MTYDLTLFSNFHEIHNFTITVADGSKIEAVGVGLIDLNLLINSKKTLVELREVYCLPKLSCNLISLGVLEKRGLTWSGTSGRLEVRDRNELIMQAIRTDTVYTLYTTQARISEPIRAFKVSTLSKQELWHHRLAHLNHADLQRLCTLAEGIDLSENPANNKPFYEACTLGKQYKTICRKKMTPANYAGKRMHVDLYGGGKTIPTTRYRLKLFIIFTDDYTLYKWVYFLKRKDDAAQKIRDHIIIFERQYAAKVKRIRIDNGTEFMSKITDFNTKKTLPKWFEE